MQVDAIRFLFPRAYVDVNRARPGEENLCADLSHQTGFDDPNLQVVYDWYHGELERLIRRSISVYGADNVLLLDMHGFSKQPSFVFDGGGVDVYLPFDLIFGTANRSTIHYGAIDRRFASFMTRKEYAVFLPQEKPICPDGDPYSAGHITRLYARKYRINAIQIEISAIFRRIDIHGDARERGEKLVGDIAEFLSVHYR